MDYEERECNVIMSGKARMSVQTRGRCRVAQNKFAELEGMVKRWYKRTKSLIPTSQNP